MPDPERPVTTISLSRGISTETFLRLWTRAPCTAMVVRGAAFEATLVWVSASASARFSAHAPELSITLELGKAGARGCMPVAPLAHSATVVHSKRRQE